MICESFIFVGPVQNSVVGFPPHPLRLWRIISAISRPVPPAQFCAECLPLRQRAVVWRLKLASVWPTYPTGSRDSIFALGLIGVKFTELESILYFLFESLFGLTSYDGTLIAAKIGSGNVAGFIDQKLKAVTFPKTYEWRSEHLLHFLAGFQICAENRTVVRGFAIGQSLMGMVILTRLQEQTNLLKRIHDMEAESREERKEREKQQANTLYKYYIDLFTLGLISLACIVVLFEAVV